MRNKPRNSRDEKPATAWYYSVGGEQRGPVPSARLVALAAAGDINPDTLVWRAGLKEWVPARKVKSLFPPPLPTPATALQPVEAESQTAASGPRPEELSWQIRVRFWQEYSRPLIAVLEEARMAAELVACIDVCTPARYSQACVQGLAAVCSLRLARGLPRAVQDAFGELRGQRDVLLQHLRSPSALLSTAAAEARKTASTGMVEGFFKGLLDAGNPATKAGAGAQVGGMIGAMLFGHYGAVVGSSVGAFLGGSQQQAADNVTASHFFEAADHMGIAVVEAANWAWDWVAWRTQEASGPALMSAESFQAAALELQQMSERYQHNPGANALSMLAELDRYLARWGPDPEALYLYSLYAWFLAPGEEGEYGRWAADARAWHLQLFPDDPLAYENAAAQAMMEGDMPGALSLACDGAARCPGNVLLQQCRLEAASALGGQAQTRAAFSALVGAGEQPWLSLIRGLLRGGQAAEAATACRDAISAGTRPATLARQLKADHLAAPHAPSLAVMVPQLREQMGRVGELRGIVEAHLGPLADDAEAREVFTLGPPPPPKFANARADFLKLRRGEEVLFFYDWSIFKDGKIGFTITSERVLWKLTWAEAVSVGLAGLAPGQVRADGTSLSVGGQSVQLEYPVLAEWLRNTIAEMASHLAVSPFL